MKIRKSVKDCNTVLYFTCGARDFIDTFFTALAHTHRFLSKRWKKMCGGMSHDGPCYG